MADNSRTVGNFIALKVGVPSYFKQHVFALPLILAVGAAGGAAYWFRVQVADGYFAAQDAVLATFGLGVAPVGVWLAVVLWVQAKRRPWFRHLNLWLGSVALVALVLGIFSFFRPQDGALGGFTLDGDVTLGGHVGHAVTGTVVWLGALRLLGVFILGVWVAFPHFTTDLAAVVGRLLFSAYLSLAVAVRALASSVAGMYRLRPNAASEGRNPAAAQKVQAPAEAPAPGRGLRTGLRSGVDVRSSHTTPAFLSREAGPPSVALPGPTETGQEQPSQLDEEDGEEPEPAWTPASAYAEEGDQSDADGPRVNKYWSSDTVEAKETQVYPGAYEDLEEAPEEARASTDGPITDTMAHRWARPPIDLLKDAPADGISQTEMDETAETIRRTLSEYDVEVEIGQTRPGPTVTMYGLVPGWVRRYKQVRVQEEDGSPKLDEAGKPVMKKLESKTRVKVDSILSREKDLALALKTPTIRIETPVLGESLVGIEVPNPKPDLVTLRSVMASREFQQLRSKAHLPIALGKRSGGDPIVVDLASMPHLLVAGATGSGKSVCLNTIVSCLITEKTPAELRLLLIDPKRVELTPYNGIPHLLTPVVVETDQVVALLKGMIREMLSRYRRMEEVSVRNIQAYNKKMPDKMPLLVVAIDELADLMMSASFDVEQSICRLAQLGRATGIHLIVATQRPSVDVVTGLIKANFPSRISFSVTSQIDSRTILDAVGADKLLGRGDMLYLAQDASRPERVQAVFVSDTEIERLVDFWQSTPWAPLPKVSLRAVGSQGASDGDGDGEDGASSRDELMDKAVDLAHRYQKLSTSLLQRRLRIGYPRAARLMDQLEDEGIVGPGDGSKPRDVIMNSQSLDVS